MPSKPAKKSKQPPPGPRSASSASPAQQQQPPPNWPALKPRIPASDLLLTPILQDQIYLIRNLLSAALCRSLVSFLSSQIPLATTPANPRRGEAVRVNDRFQIDDARFAGRLWRETGLAEVVGRGVFDDEDEEDDEGGDGRQDIWGGEVLGLNPNIRIYRYTPGQFFAQHCT